jgi:predicted transcriptional regulator
MKEDKKVILHLIISEIKKGKNPSKISKEHNIKKQTLQYYLRQLKQKGIIEKQGYGIWKVSKEVSISSKAYIPKKQIRGHAFNWKVKFKHNIIWERRLKDNKIKYQLIGIKGSTPRIIFNDKKIWFTKTGLVIYEPKSFFSQSSLTSKGQAVWELDKTIKALGKVLKIDLGTYQFTTSREHYGQIKNELAKQYNDKGEKLYIRDDKGIWMWIDFSHGVHELETNDTKNSRGVQVWYNDMKKTNFEVTPTFLLNSINQVTQNQIMFDKNFQSHLEVIKNLNKAVLELREEISLLKNKKKNLLETSQKKTLGC